MFEGFEAKVLELQKQLDKIPWDHATIKSEYKKCGSPRCACGTPGLKYYSKIHGPYLYAYWKDKGKLRKKYIGKTKEEYQQKLEEKAWNQVSQKNWTHRQWTKYNLIINVSQSGASKIAEQYAEKLGSNPAANMLFSTLDFSESGLNTERQQSMCNCARSFLIS